ncbi:DUF3341 domain-containing protein [Rhodohalobacter halophilus]|uniref:DUF3341 domain-containing protein n=1 Tax=Rhodohalobacter halophilus TaxID=1812810 RepID=UPI00083FB52E|nr:DUF3341 domain-containing protein [Rhodohalobacter halophilus]
MSKSTDENNMYGILAEFKNPKQLIDAAKKINQSGFKKYDTFSPFPIHGIDKAMNLPKSKLGWIVVSHGLVGMIGAFSMIYFMMVADYPLNISGKTLMNIPAWVPVIFELTVLLSAFGAVFGMFFLNGLPRFNHPLFTSENFKKATDDGFFVCIEAEDPQFDTDKVQTLLKEAGGTNIEEIYDN